MRHAESQRIAPRLGRMVPLRDVVSLGPKLEAVVKEGLLPILQASGCQKALGLVGEVR